MKQVQLSQWLSKIPVILLCLILLAPAGTAAERTGRAIPAGESTTSLANGASPDSPQLLTDEELTELSARAKEPGPAVVGGALSNLHLTYIVIALATAVIILVLK